MGALTEVGKWK